MINENLLKGSDLFIFTFIDCSIFLFDSSSRKARRYKELSIEAKETVKNIKMLLEEERKLSIKIRSIKQDLDL